MDEETRNILIRLAKTQLEITKVLESLPDLEASQKHDDALEALDFTINVLKEHEKELDRLVNEFCSIKDQMTNLITSLSTPKTQAMVTAGG
jgi:hypothetical protein